MVDIPIKLDFQRVLFSLRNDPWPPSLDDIKFEDRGDVTIISAELPYKQFEKELIDAVRSAPGDVERLNLLGDYGILLKELDTDGDEKRTKHLISGPFLHNQFFVMNYNGGICVEEGLKPNPGYLTKLTNGIGHSRIPDYMLDFGTLTCGDNERADYEEKTKRWETLTFEQRFLNFVTEFEAIGKGMVEEVGDAIYLVKMADISNCYVDLKKIKEQRIPYKGN